MWTRKYSFALEMFDEIFRAWKGNQIARFLDYDGTLSPIVNEPDKAYMSEAKNGQMCAMVKGVVSYFPIEIVCSRCRDKELEFTEFAYRPVAYAKICSMIALSIYGHVDVKKAIACLLFGGSKKVGILGWSVHAKLGIVSKRVRRNKAPNSVFNTKITNIVVIPPVALLYGQVSPDVPYYFAPLMFFIFSQMSDSEFSFRSKCYIDILKVGDYILFG